MLSKPVALDQRGFGMLRPRLEGEQPLATAEQAAQVGVAGCRAGVGRLRSRACPCPLARVGLPALWGGACEGRDGHRLPSCCAGGWGSQGLPGVVCESPTFRQVITREDAYPCYSSFSSSPGAFCTTVLYMKKSAYIPNPVIIVIFPFPLFC